MSGYKKLKLWFDEELGHKLAAKIEPLYSEFSTDQFIKHITQHIADQELKQRVETIADGLHQQLPASYTNTCDIFHHILGPENYNETGMFTEGYWLMPIAFYVEKYGVNHFNCSMKLIEELTKRHTGEYAVRPFVQQYPNETLMIAHKWALSDNAHVRRLASEGLRPRLPWAKKLVMFSDNPAPIIDVLEHLKSDSSAYVRKSVANNMADLLKENYDYAFKTLNKWSKTRSKETRWIIKHALRNEVKKLNPHALSLLETEN